MIAPTPGHSCEPYISMVIWKYLSCEIVNIANDPAYNHNSEQLRYWTGKTRIYQVQRTLPLVCESWQLDVHVPGILLREPEQVRGQASRFLNTSAPSAHANYIIAVVYIEPALLRVHTISCEPAKLRTWNSWHSFEGLQTWARSQSNAVSDAACMLTGRFSATILSCHARRRPLHCAQRSHYAGVIFLCLHTLCLFSCSIFQGFYKSTLCDVCFDS